MHKDTRQDLFEKYIDDIITQRQPLIAETIRRVNSFDENIEKIDAKR